tara:strand:- start:1722 stop:6824 length:5103 start_codon:yes stop_codon:yes gene_type:complete
MAKAINTFLKSKMNKDLDARLIPSGEYRDAYNLQVSKSEGDGVGTVENVLGNYSVFDFEAITGVNNLYCIGHLEDDNSNTVFLFLTDNPDPSNPNKDYYPTGVGSNHFIFACNPNASAPVCLVKGAFLNFSKKNPIYGVNLLETLLFWTDNRNQPRKINIELANPTGFFTNATYYTFEDQISVAKYNPYSCMELYSESYLSNTVGEYETTMYDVSSLYYPNGGAGNVLTRVSDTVVRVTSFQGDIQGSGSTYGSGALVSVLGNPAFGGGLTPVAGATVDSASYNTTDPQNPYWEITIVGGVFPALNTSEKIVLNPNPYYDVNFSGDPDFLEDKFVRFSYRFRFDDNEYSLFAPFTQIAFIPKQDGYFMYVKENTLNLQELDNQADAYRSTVVYFVENKLDEIKLRIPLPFLNYNLEDSLKIKEIDILYKESDAIAVKVIDTVTVSDVSNSAGNFTVNGAITASNTIVIDNLQGGINVGDIISGTGIVGQPKVLTYTPTDVNNPSIGGTITVDPSNAQTLQDDAILSAGEPSYYVYNYLSKKPFKTLPEKDLTRVYDKIPVRSLSQEIAGNRVIYANYQNKHTPPKYLNYNVSVSNKSDFELNESEATYSGGGGTIAPRQPIDIDLIPGSSLIPGSVLSSNTPGVVIPPDTLVSSTNNNGEGVFVSGNITFGGNSPNLLLNNMNGFIPIGATVDNIDSGIPAGVTVVSITSQTQTQTALTVSQTVSFSAGDTFTFTSTSQTEAIISLTNEVTFPAGVVDLDFEPESNVINTTSIIEYPNSSLKQNRNYQVGVLLSDKFGRTSTVILSNNKEIVRFFGQAFSGSTVYSPYSDISQTPSDWPGDSLKILFNEVISSTRNLNTGTPGLYNGDITSLDYNPLGWYSFKIVVKQTEQEYYNVYLPGIMASYPEDVTLELGNTSHTVLINDNINKVPRDLSQVGPQQKQFRSSVQLYGRVQNTNIEIDPTTDLGSSNEQYYPGRSSDTVSTISTLNDLFEYNPSEVPRPNYFPQFYSIESNPLVARISTESKIGQIATTNFDTVTANIAESATTDTFRLVDIAGDTSTIIPGDIVLSNNFPKDLKVVQFLNGASAGSAQVITGTPAGGDTSFVVDAIPTGGAGNGTLVTANGIPAGTAITNITGTAPSVTLTVSNIVNVSSGTTITYTTAPTLQVDTPQTVTLDQTITIIPDSTPGIQYLAVYETKPVESLLDIFWETSTSGLISDLNNAIINQDSAGATLTEFNQTPFTEGLALGGNVLSAPFYVLDNFGSLVSIIDITTPLELVEVSNGVQDITDLNYFTLVQTSPNQNEFQIITTAAYYNDIYFGEDDSSSPPNLRSFSLKFTAVVNGQNLDVTRDLILANVAPTINLPLDGTTFNITNNTENITTIDCVNGADNVNLASLFSNGSCTITSQTNSQGDVNYFDILDEPTIVGGEAKFQLINTQVGNVPIDRYELTICIQDAGGQNDQDCIDIVIDFGAKVRNIKQYSFERRFGRKWSQVGGASQAGSSDTWYQTMTVFEVYGGASSAAWGWYLYNGPWSNESSLESLTTLSFSTAYGIDNFPNNFISTNTNIGQVGVSAQTMLGPQQPPLLNTLGGNGFVTVEFNTVNLSPLCENLRFSPTSEADVISLWDASCYIYGYCVILFPGVVPPQDGNYAITDIDRNAAPSGFGWSVSGGARNEVTAGTFIIDENNYDVDSIAWQVNV